MSKHQDWKKAAQDLRKLLRSKKKKYFRVFSEDEDGEFILKDLSKTFGLNSSAFIPGPGRERDEAYKLGQQSVVLYIAQQMNMNDAQIRAITQEADKL